MTDLPGLTREALRPGAVQGFQFAARDIAHPAVHHGTWVQTTDGEWSRLTVIAPTDPAEGDKLAAATARFQVTRSDRAAIVALVGGWCTGTVMAALRSRHR